MRLRPVLHVARDLEEAAGPLLVEAIEAAIYTCGRCRIAVSGGTTPADSLAWIARHLAPSAYARLWVTWTHELALPLEPDAVPSWVGYDARSNLRLTYLNWLDAVPRPARVLPMLRTGDLDADCAAFERAFVEQFDGGLDVVVLGVGADGHVASLFPDSDALHAEARAVVVRDAPVEPRERISLTLSTLQAVDMGIVLARGAEKAAILQAAWEGCDAPIGRYTPRGAYHWVLDEAAARQLPA